MRVYDDAGNMCNSHAAAISREGAANTAKMFEVLFRDGMTIVEARALLGYFKSELDITVTMQLMLQQLKGTNEAN